MLSLQPRAASLLLTACRATPASLRFRSPPRFAVDGDATAFARSLDGVFAFVLVDEKRGVVAVGRDPYGVRPLFQAEIFAPATSVPADTEAALLPSAGTEAGCATSPAGSTAAFLARVESWAGPCPTVKQLPDRVVAAAHLPSLPVSGPLPQHYPLLWSSELRAVLPAVDQAVRACLIVWPLAFMPPHSPRHSFSLPSSFHSRAGTTKSQRRPGESAALLSLSLPARHCARF